MLDSTKLPTGRLLSTSAVGQAVVRKGQSDEVYDVVAVQGKTVLGVGHEH